MSAKLEQPISPSFTRMINLLNEEEKKHVCKQSLIDLEANILCKLGFDFNFPGPIQFMERYLRILGYDLNKVVYEMAFQISKFQLNDAKFLNFRPSQLAACAVLLAINIYEKDRSTADKFFKDCKVKDGLKELNLYIWNNPMVHNVTGYSIESLKQPMFEMSDFIRNNLSPNRLEGFDVEAILNVEMYLPVVS